MNTPTEASLCRVQYVQYAPPMDENDIPYGRGRIAIRNEWFRIIRYTPAGAWIDYESGEKFVNLRAKKQFACASLAEARESFRQRKARQLHILHAQIETIERALRQLTCDEEPCPF